jgi:hypothetical protein
MNYITELFCSVDDFWKEFQTKGNSFLANLPEVPHVHYQYLK